MDTDRRIWQGVLCSVTLVLAAALALIVALALGWNSPVPTRPPDWQAADLPACLRAAARETTVALLEHPASDLVFEATATLLSGPDSNAYGIVYRAQDAAHYYSFAVGSDGYYAVLRVEGGERVALVDWHQFPHVRRGQRSNRLRVDCAGAVCRFYINDEYAVTVEDDTWLAGDVGLFVRGDESDIAVQFQSARVWEAIRNRVFREKTGFLSS